MAKKTLKDIGEDELNIYLDLLSNGIYSLKSYEGTKNFIKSLLTSSEILMLGRRIYIAKMILEGKTYDEIKTTLNVGLDTIANVYKTIFQQDKSYSKLIKKLERKIIKEKEDLLQEDTTELYSFKNLRRAYPLHFLLFNLWELTSKKSYKKK